MTQICSPCIDVCKYKLRGHCIGCAMTRAQRDLFDRLPGEDARRAFIDTLRAQQVALGDRFRGWERAYRRKCDRAGAPCVLDAPRAAAAE